MKINDLKDKLYSLNKISMIWVLKDESSEVISHQYINEIAKHYDLTPKRIDSFMEIPDAGFIEDNNLYIIKTDKFDKENNQNNCIVICNKCEDKDAIQFPKLEEWQVIDYLLAIAPGIGKDGLTWLVNQYDGHYAQVINEVEKYSLFKDNIQRQLFESFVRNGEYDSHSSLKIWDLSNALLKKDRRMVTEVMKVIDHVDITSMYLHTVLYNNFKNVLSIQLNPNIKASDLGIKDNQFWAIKKNNVGYYSPEQLIKIFEMLTDMEYRFKFGGIDPDNQMVDYMVIKILEA